ncbi:MAG: transcription termination/antitermination protein NusG [Acidimicrobiales bacterium]
MPAPSESGPVCPSCRADLASQLVTTRLPVQIDGEEPSGDALALYCGGCQRLLGILPGPPGRHPAAGATGPTVGAASVPGPKPTGAGGPGPGPGAPAPAPDPGPAPRIGERVVLDEGQHAGRDAIVRAVDPETGWLVVEVSRFGKGVQYHVDPDAIRKRDAAPRPGRGATRP